MDPQPDVLSDGEAFERFVVPELDVLARVARSIVHRPADAEDVVQDTLLRAYRAIGRFDGRYPRAWLLTIMRNAYANRVRWSRSPLVHDPVAAQALQERAGTSGQEVEDAVVGPLLGDGLDDVTDLVAQLPPAFRHVVQLVDVQGLTYREAAEALGVPPGTVMSRLHRARRRLRERLAAPASGSPSGSSSTSP